jgi:hypothetical protein
MTEFVPRLPFRAKQREGFERAKDAPAFFLSMEQRCGKSGVALAKAGHSFLRGRVDAMLIFAPNGPHRKWIVDEAPKFLPDEVPWRGHFWRASRASTKKDQKVRDDVLAFPGLAIFSINSEAIGTKAARAFMTTLLKRRKVLLVVDESDQFSTPGAERTKLAIRVGERAVEAMDLTGTPTDGNPLHLYAQYAILDRRILGFSSFYAFKHRYAEWTVDVVPERVLTDRERRVAEAIHRDGKGPPPGMTETIVRYQNLPELLAKIAPFTFRATRAEMFDMPPLNYDKEWFELSDPQRAVYESLREEYRAEIAGRRVSAPHVLTRYLRLQQVASNYWPGARELKGCRHCAEDGRIAGPGCDECDWLGVEVAISEASVVDPARNPRLEALDRVLSSTKSRALIWCRFTRDVDDVLGFLRARGETGIRYDGKTADEEKATAETRFRDGVDRAVVGQPRAGGRGLDFSPARLEVFYSNEFGLRPRLQAESRPINPAVPGVIDCVDLVAGDTIDEPIVAALRDKKNVADVINGDPTGRAWL